MSWRSSARNLFNVLDARGAISVTERVGVIGRIRNLAVGVAKAYALQQAAMQRRDARGTGERETGSQQELATDNHG